MPQASYTDTPARAVPGMIANAMSYDAITGVNPATLTNVLRPGLFVVRNSTVAGREKEVKPPALAADITGGAARGVVIHQDLHINPNTITDVDRAYFQPGESLAVMKRGHIFVSCETNWTSGANPFVRFTEHDGLIAGSFRNDVDTQSSAATAVLVQFCRFVDTGTGPGVAEIEFDVKPATA